MKQKQFAQKIPMKLKLREMKSMNLKIFAK